MSKKFLLFWALLIMMVGLIGILAAVLVTPDFTLRYLSEDHFITQAGFIKLARFRVCSLVAGIGFLLAGILVIRFSDRISKKEKFGFHLILAIAFLLFCWIVLGFTNYFLLRGLDINLGTRPLFPISQFEFRLDFHGWYFIFLFFAGAWLFKKLRWKRELTLWLAGLFLIISGNLMQGDYQKAFLNPFTASKVQYYHDAVKIKDAAGWLQQFNTNQPQLLVHSRTHPPFAVLLHYWVMKAFGVYGLPIVFVLISSLTLLWVFRILEELNIERENACLLSLLFALTPAFNIYSAASLDAVIASFMTLGLWGLIRLLKNGPEVFGAAALFLGLLTSNLLSFGAFFLIAVSGLFVVLCLFVQRRIGPAVVLFLCLAGTVFFLAGIKIGWGYDHLEAFFTASRLENPAGFSLLAAPVQYFATRLENIAEILLFLSLPCAALLLFPRKLVPPMRKDVIVLVFMGIGILFVIFFTGAYRTGETARTCLFIYPYLFLFLGRVSRENLEKVILIAAVQTGLMQLLGSYFW